MWTFWWFCYGRSDEWEYWCQKWIYRVNCLGIKIWGAWERERDSIDDRIQDDGELIQRNLVQDPDNPDDGELEGKEESDGDESQSKSWEAKNQEMVTFHIQISVDSFFGDSTESIDVLDANDVGVLDGT